MWGDDDDDTSFPVDVWEKGVGSSWNIRSVFLSELGSPRSAILLPLLEPWKRMSALSYLADDLEPGTISCVCSSDFSISVHNPSSME